MRHMQWILAILLAGSASSWGASFDCGKAASRSEKLICVDAALSALDEDLARAYQQALEHSDDRSESTKEQRHWLSKVRDACPDSACLQSAYQARIAELSQAASQPKINEPEMIAIPGKNFEIGKFEVTQKQWQDIMGSNPSHVKGDDLPVDTVGTAEIEAYLFKLNQLTGKKYRLPTQAEWEYACNKGAKRGVCGNKPLEDIAWFEGNSGGQPHPVGQKQPNAFGLYDMSGNVGERVQSKNKDTAVSCGNAWNVGKDTYAQACYETTILVDEFANDGFRLARSCPCGKSGAKSDVERLRKFIVAGNAAKVHDYFQSSKAQLNSPVLDGLAPLTFAVDVNKPEVVAELLAQGAEVDALDKNGATPLQHAAAGGFAEIASLLVQKGARVNVRNKYGSNAFYLAAFIGRKDIAEMLIAHGADINVLNVAGASALQQVISRKDFDMARYLIAKGADCTVKYPNGDIPLHRPIVLGITYLDDIKDNLELIKSLLSCRLSINAKDGAGNTPMHIAMSYATPPEIVDFLLAHGADVNALNNDGKTPLQKARAEGRAGQDIIGMLIARGGKE